jgi:hypothetical protein
VRARERRRLNGGDDVLRAREPPRAPCHRRVPGAPLTVLVDAAIWQGRAGRYAHLASDFSYEELHAFAALLGLPERAFHRDHYDLPERLRDTAVALGAHPVDARELVHRLRAAGLRVRRRAPPE